MPKKCIIGVQRSCAKVSVRIDDAKMSYFTTQDGCRLYYETEGRESSKPLVAFLNGTTQTTLYWRPQVTFFKDEYQVLTYDARAQGQSDVGEARLSLEGHAADFVQLLAHLDVEKAHLVGLSHGAKVALACAAHSPQCVERLVLCSMGASLSCRGKLLVKSWLETLRTSGLEAMIWASLPVAFGEGFLKHKEGVLRNIVKATVTRNKKEALIAHLEAMSRYGPISHIAGSIHKQCLVISGADDPLVPEEEARHLAALCTAVHKPLSGVGHSVPVEDPERFNQTVLEFLKAS